MIFVYGYLGYLKDKIKQEKRYLFDFIAVDLEEASELLGGDIYKVELRSLSWLSSYDVLTLDIVALAQNL